MDEFGSRTRLLLGDDAAEQIRRASVLLCGCGAVGGYAGECLVRQGVGRIVFVDGDAFSASNLNRQILCTRDTEGMRKCEAAVIRARSINPDIVAECIDTRIDASSAPRILDTGCDVLADCIDTIACKAELIRQALKAGMPVFSSMGMAMRRDPLRLHRTTLDRTSVCPVARNLRKALRDVDTSLVSVVFSDEEVPQVPHATDEFGKGVIGSLPTVPMAAGAAVAQMVLDHITRGDGVRRMRVPNATSPATGASGIA